MNILDELQVSVLGDENRSTVSLSSLREGKSMVIDFWTSKCVKCPAALEKLNEEAGESKGEIIFVSCALSQGDGNKEVVGSLVADEEWDNLTHTFMDMTNKEVAKAAFGFTTVPFYVVVSKDGRVVGRGEPKNTDYVSLLAAAAAITNPAEVDAPMPSAKVAVPAPVPQHASNVFTLDEDF